MGGQAAIRGVWCATLTPLDANGRFDHQRLVAHAHQLFNEGVDGIAPFGTTGEGQSFGLAERRAGLERIIAAGVAPHRILAATGCAALPETVELTRHAVEAGCAGALVLPPFFWKDATDDGMYAYYATLIDRVGNSSLRMYLYHIPQVTAVPITTALIKRLRAAHPGVVAGLKDSAGDLEHSRAMVARFPELAVFVGHEPHLPAMRAAGGAGTICGVANFFPRLVRRLHENPGTPDCDAALDTIRRFVEIALAYPLMPAFKALQAHLTGDDGWRAVRPPLAALPAADSGAMLERLRTSGIIPR